MSATPSPTPRYRLSWLEFSSGDLPMSRPGDLTGAWVGSDDPLAIKRYVAGRRWASETVLTLTIEDASNPIAEPLSATFRPEAVKVWSPAKAPLPGHDPSLAHPRSRAAATLALMRDLDTALRTATSADVVSREDADGLKLLLREVLEQHRAATAGGTARS